MKKIVLLFFMLASITTIAQSKDYLLSEEGIGSLKLYMSLTELEKVLHTKIKLKVINVDSIVLVETINTKYKGIDIDITLIKRQDDIVVEAMSSSSPLCKTKSGIGIGAGKLQIIAAYDGYHIDIEPVDEGESKSKTIRTVKVKQGSEGYAILFTLINNKVVSFDIFPDYDDEE